MRFHGTDDRALDGCGYLVGLPRAMQLSRVGTEKFLKLLLLLGKRRNAIQTMRWADINEDWHWTPPEGSKNKRNSPIPLPKLVQRILGTRRDGENVLVRRMTDFTVAKLAEDICKAVEPTYLHHGIRHVVATKLRQLKVAPHVARLLLDHAGPGDAHSGYEHVDWTDEMLEALETCCSHIEKLVAPGEGVAVLR